MMQNIAMQGIYDKDLQDYSQFIVNGNDYKIYAQEKNLSCSITLVSAIELI